MKNRLALNAICILCLLSSCTSVKFKEAQPKDVKAVEYFPGNMTGIFKDTENNRLEISDRSIKINSGGKNDTDYVDLSSEKAVLKEYKGYYVLSIRNEDDNLWEVAVFKPEKEKISIYYINIDDKNKASTLEKLRKITDVSVVPGRKEGESEDYVLDPSKKEFIKMIRKGIFKESIVFRKNGD